MQSGASKAPNWLKTSQLRGVTGLVVPAPHLVWVWPIGVVTWSLSLGCPSVRAAEPSAGLQVHVASDSCPSASLLREKLEPLLDDELGEIQVSHSLLMRPGFMQADVRDLGQRYVVELEGKRREIDDAAHDCVERARVAAVFLALNLQPGPARTARSDGLRAGLSLHGAAVYAPKISEATGGGALGFWLQSSGLRLELSLGAYAPVDVPLRAYAALQPTASVMRLPILLGLSYVFEAGRLRFGPGAGLALELFRIHGERAEHPQTALRIDPGLLISADVGIQLTEAWSVGLRLTLEALAKAYALKLDRSETLGRTPRLWLSAGLGLSCRFL